MREAAQPAILVGHSRGGVLISEVAERAPENVAFLVYVSGFLVPHGASIVSTIKAAQPEGTEPQPFFAVDPQGRTTLLPEVVAAKLYSHTDPDWQAHAEAHLVAEPLAALTAPVSLTEARFGSVRRAYIEATNDRLLPLSLQRAMQARLPCELVFSIPTDHSPAYSTPTELVEHLQAIAAHAGTNAI